MTLAWAARLAVAGIVCGLAGCAGASPEMGQDRRSDSNASTITWTDGKPAVAISCRLPGGCQERALAICRQGPFTTLRSENMPTAGSGREPQRPPSVVIRCG